MTEKKRKATKGQKQRIAGMLESGLIDYDEAQKIIESCEPSVYRLHVTYAPLPGVGALEKKFSGEGSVCHSFSDQFDDNDWDRHSSLIDMDETPGERVFRLAWVPEDFLGARILDCCDSLVAHFGRWGERFAIETEAVEFAEAYPKPQRKNRILVLGSSKPDDFDHGYVATLDMNDVGRVLGSCCVKDQLKAGDRLLLVSQP